jgi:phage baseplate assembly protein V
MKPEMLLRMVRKVVEPIKRSVQLMIGRAILATVSDSKGIQEVKLTILAGEVKEMERFQNYGFSSNPLPGAEALSVFVSGDREHGICLAIDDRRYRLKSLPNGAVGLYDAIGSTIILKNDGEVEIKGTTKTIVDSPAIELGSTALEAILKGETFQTFFNAHTHIGNLGVATSPPSTPSDPSHLSLIVKGS